MSYAKGKRPRSTKGRHHPLNVIIGQRVHDFREEAGWSVEAMADKLGISPFQLRQNEAGRNRIGIDRLYAIACLLRRSLDDFVESVPRSVRRGLPRYRRRTVEANDNERRRKLRSAA